MTIRKKDCIILKPNAQIWLTYTDSPAEYRKAQKYISGTKEFGL